MTATECGSLDFESYGPLAFLCQAIDGNAAAAVTFWGILRKVQLEAVLWGFGTALGELPPYFVARAARLAHQSAPEELAEVEKELREGKASLVTRAKVWVTTTVERVGFVGILLFASIPNPLFDLAGLTCGHIGVPFWTFFVATALGKAVVKVHGQTAFVITIFNVHYLEALLEFLARHLPPAWHDAIRTSFHKQRASLHRTPGEIGAADLAAAPKSIFSAAWDGFLALMIAYFVVSIVNSMAQGHQAMLDEIELLTLESRETTRLTKKTTGLSRSSSD